VAVSIDEARRHDHARGIYHLRIGGGDVRAHGGNLAAFDQDVGPLEVADRVVERKHASVLDQKRTAGDGAGHRLLSMGGDNYRGRGGNRTRRAGTEELAP
jgi:hypothetical protein